jgi:PBSX family phage terminase large subunit
LKIPDIKLDFSEKAYNVLFSDKKLKILYGGRGGKKSYDISDYLILKALEGKRILCTRMYQNSIEESVLHLIKNRIYDHKLENYFTITKTSITGKNGSEFIFKGIARDILSIKSIAGIDIAWVEEAVDVSEHSWDVFLESIRPKPDIKIVDGETIIIERQPEIIVSFNPDNEQDATFRLFVTGKRQNMAIAKVNYYDNKFFPKYLYEDMEECKALDYDKYCNIWLGEPCNFTGKIYKEFLRDQEFLVLQPIYNNDRVVGCLKDGKEIFFENYWNYYTGLDTGSKTGWILKAIDQDQNEYNIDEIYNIDGLVKDISTEIHVKRTGRNIIGNVIDSASQVKREYEANRLYFSDSSKDVLGSIQKLREKQSMRKWFVLSNCQALINELRMREWTKKADSKGKIYPVKEYDHLINAEDYIQTTFLRSNTPKIVTPMDKIYLRSLHYAVTTKKQMVWKDLG